MFTLSLKILPKVLFHSLLTCTVETDLKTCFLGVVSQISIMNGKQTGNGGAQNSWGRCLYPGAVAVLRLRPAGEGGAGYVARA